MFKTPILLIIYKRADTTQKLINQLRILKPSILFIAADGPKNQEDIEKCNSTRQIIDTIDWNCSIQKLYQDENLGVAWGPKTAIDWFFEQNEMGIILEDDILPALDFFPFCEELLEKYKNEPKILHINAMNFHLGKNVVKESYYFSKVTSPWGWATWRRAWKLYDFDMKELDSYVDNLGLPSQYKSEFYRCKKTPFTWDYQWLYTVLKNKGMSVAPTKNLALNLGFEGINASHTFLAPNWTKKIKLEELKTITHPKEIRINDWADELTFVEIAEGYPKSIMEKIKFLKIKYFKRN